MKALEAIKNIGVVACLILLVAFSSVNGSLGVAILAELGILPQPSRTNALGGESSESARLSRDVKISLLPTSQESTLGKPADRTRKIHLSSELQPKSSTTRPSQLETGNEKNERVGSNGLPNQSPTLTKAVVSSAARTLDGSNLLGASSSSSLTAAAGTIFVSQITDIGSGLKKIVVTTDFDALTVDIRIGNDTVGYWPWTDITSSKAQVGSYWEYEYVFNATALAEGYWSVQARALDSTSSMLYSSPSWFLVDYVPQKILVVDDDENFKNDYYPYYKQVLSRLGLKENVSFDKFVTVPDGSGPSASVLQQYDLVIWFTGVDWDITLTSADRSNLITYFNNGGQLWLIGQDIAYDLTYYDPNFFGNYLKANSTTWRDYPGASPQGVNATLTVAGLTSTFFAGLSYTLKNFDGYVSKYPDEITAVTGATNVLNYPLYSGDIPNNAAIWYNSSYRLLYFSFNLEAIAIHDLAGAVDLTNRSINLFSGGYGKPPTIAIQSPSNGSLLSSSTVNLNWIAADPDSPSLIYRIYVDGTYVGQTQSTSYSLSLSEGIHAISVKVIDDTGQEAVDFLVIDVDSQAPIFPQVPSDIQYAEGEPFSNAHLLTWNVSDSHPDRYFLYRNGISVDNGSWTQKVWQYTYNASGLPLGTYNYTLKVMDQAGHVSVDTVWLTVYDGTPPIIQGKGNISVIEGAIGKNVNWTVTDAHPTTYKIYKDGIEIKNGTWSSGSILSASLDNLTWRSYPYNFTLVVEDVGGNVARMTTFVIVLDVIAPIFNKEPSGTISYPEGSSGNTLSWNASDLHPDIYTVYRNGSVMSEGSWFSNGLITISIDGLFLGRYNFTMVVRDLAGNVNTSTVWVTVHDATAPEITASGDLSYNNGTVGNYIYWNITELHPLNYTIYYINITNQGTEKIWQEGMLNSSYESIVINVDGLTIGKHNFTLLARDQSYNHASFTIIVTVLDAQIPIIRLVSHGNESILGLTTILEFNLTDNNALNYTFYRWNDPNVFGGTSVALNGSKTYLLTLSPPTTITTSGWYDLYLFVNDSAVTPQNNNFSIHFRFYIDVQGPIVMKVDPLNNSYLSPTATILLTLQDNASITFVEYYWNGTRYNNTSPSSLLVIQVPNVNGSEELILNIQDSFGNWNNGTRFWYFIDGTVPQLNQITFIYSDPPKDNDPTIGVKVNITDAHAGVSSVWFVIHVNGSATPTYNVSASFVDGWWIWIPSSPFQLPAGSNLTIVIIARDAVIGTPNKLMISRWWIIQDHDVTPPTIEEFTYQSGTNVENNNLTILVKATDNLRGVNKVIVSYRVQDTGSWINVTATHDSSSGYYRATLPTFLANTTLEVKTFVIDGSLNENVAISSIMQVFITDSDFEAPTILSVAPQSGTNYDNATLTIIINATDTEKGINQVIVSYKTTSNTTWTNVTASYNGSVWIASLPSFIVGTKVYLKVYAEDKSLNCNQALLALDNPIVIQESDVYPPIVNVFYNNQTNYEGLSLQILVNATDKGKGIEQVVISYKAKNDLSETPWRNVTAYYSQQDGLYVAFLPQFPANTTVHVKALVRDASSLGNWATSQELTIVIQSSQSNDSQARESAIIDSAFPDKSLQLVPFEENFTFWIVWGYTAGGKISFLETTNVSVELIMGTLDANNSFIPDFNQEYYSSVKSVSYLGSGNYSLTVFAKDLNKIVLIAVTFSKSGFTPLTYVIAIQVVPRAASVQVISMPSEFRLGEERTITFGWKDALNGSWINQNVSILVYLNGTQVTNLTSIGVYINEITQFIPIAYEGWNLTLTLSPEFGWLRGTYNLTLVLIKNGYQVTSHVFLLDVKGYDINLIVNYPEEIVTGSEINITVQLVLNVENSTTSSQTLVQLAETTLSSTHPLLALSLPSLGGVNVSIAVTLVYLDGTNFTWSSWSFTDASGRVTFTIPGTLTSGLFAISQISVETPGTTLLDVESLVIPSPPILVEGSNGSNQGENISPNISSIQNDSLLSNLTELIPLLAMILLPVVALTLYYLRKSRRTRSKKRLRERMETRRTRRTIRSQIRSSSQAMSREVFVSEGRVTASSLSQLPPAAREVVSVDPIALERTQDFLKIAGWLVVIPDGTLIEGSVAPWLQVDLNLETIAALHSFSPTSSISSRGRVETSSAGGFTFVIATGEVLRLIIMLFGENQQVSKWLSEGMIAALSELESHVQELASTRQLSPYLVITQLRADTIVLTLESYLPLQLLYPLMLVKAQLVQLEQASAGVPRYIIDGLKVLTLSFYLSSRRSPEEVAAILANESASTLTKMFKEQIPTSFVPRTTLQELWNILTQDLRFPQKTAAEIIIEGLKWEVIRADM